MIATMFFVVMGSGGPSARTLSLSYRTSANAFYSYSVPKSRAQAGLLQLCVPGCQDEKATNVALLPHIRSDDTTHKAQFERVAWYADALVTAVRTVAQDCMVTGSAMVMLQGTGVALLPHIWTDDAKHKTRFERVAWYADVLVTAVRAVAQDYMVTGSAVAMLHSGMGVPLVAAMLLGVPIASAVCTNCKDTIVGCTGGDACPLVSNVVSNALIFSAKTLGSAPKLTHILPSELAALFGRTVCDAMVGIACAPAQGTEVDFGVEPYLSSNQAIVKSALYGHCSVAEAQNELGRRMEALLADDADGKWKLKVAFDGLKLAGESSVTVSHGLLEFIWAKVSTVFAKRQSGVVSLDTGGGKRNANAMTATLARPKSVEDFMEMLHLWMLMVVSLGIALFPVAARFLDDVVYGAMRTKETFQVAHELLLLYLKELDRDGTGVLSMANVYRRGGQDTLLTEARRNAAVFFRTRAGDAREPGPGPALNPTGKCSTTSVKPCKDFNLGKPCSRLDTKGNCVFNHKCDQFVDDKGAAGVCFGNHARCTGCDYDAAHKVSKPSQ